MEFKVPHLRNMYQKVGMFGFQDISATDGPFTNQGAQVRGSGFSHDGSFDTMDRFLSANVFALSSAEQEDIEANRKPEPRSWPTEVVREAVDENTGKPFVFKEVLHVYQDYVPDLQPHQVDARTRALASGSRRRR